MEGLEIKVEKEIISFGIEIVEAAGTLDSNTVSKFTGFVASLLEEKSNKLILDLKNLEYVSSAGIGAIIEYHDKAAALAGDIKLLNVGPRIKKVMELCGVFQLVETFDSEEAAVESYRQKEVKPPDAKFPGEYLCPSCRRRHSCCWQRSVT